MGTPYVGEIRMFAGNFAPAGWNFCDGSSQSISNYETLYALIGTTYGGDGQSTFNLPDLRGRVPIHQGTGTGGGGAYSLGQVGGVEQVTLTTQQLPQHNHPLIAATVAGDSATPQGGQVLSTEGPASISPPTWLPSGGSNQVTLNNASLSQAGGTASHTNVQPTLAVNYIISLFGVYPSAG